MYYPFFRGKQFELIAIRETATLIAESNFTPIIEPVRASLKSLERSLESLQTVGARALVIINPRHGDLSQNGQSVCDLLEHFISENIIPAVQLDGNYNPSHEIARLRQLTTRPFGLIHAGASDASSVIDAVVSEDQVTEHVFLDEFTSRLYRRRFSGATTKVLVRDGFQNKRNADYDHEDYFSDLHVTFDEMNVQGYGDFLTVGDMYSEGGGPAYAVAIHLTYIDPSRDDAMFVRHFVSDTNDTPTDPAGKFAQALDKLVTAAQGEQSKIYDTAAVAELFALHEKGHFPGLGYVKKLSIKHHLETMARYRGGASHD
ncbi:sce7725 family protein [Arsenicicoccus dermatophilus]|uniref:sce7725 family protein n=1 Tax=Arsenicicoccus dermatophilus TaxID=1076331 RepID=UPI00391718E3